MVESAGQLAAFHYRHRLDRFLVLFHLARQSPRSAEASSRTQRRVSAAKLWSVHGGGFYHAQKYKVAPRQLPETLHWFKWEAYTTWLSGMFLLVLVYWYGAEVYLDRSRGCRDVGVDCRCVGRCVRRRRLARL